MRAPFDRIATEFGAAARLGVFGRTELAALEIDPARALEICAWARMEESLRIDFLESFTAYEEKGELVLTWFARSLSIGHDLAIRTRVPSPEDGAWLELPSMVAVWPQAQPFESELSPLFGIRFTGSHQPSTVLRDYGTAETFPLRRSFLWQGDAQP